MGGGCSIAPVSNIANEISIMAEFFAEVAVDLTGSIVDGHFRFLMHDDVLECFLWPTGTLYYMRRVRDRLLDVDCRDFDRVCVHDGATMLFICGLRNTEIIITAGGVHFELVKTNRFIRGCVQDHCSTSIDGETGHAGVQVSFYLF